VHTSEPWCKRDERDEGWIEMVAACILRGRKALYEVETSGLN
jgi:hypothetical protein